SQVPSIQSDTRMGHPSGGHTGIAEEPGGEQFRQVGCVLDGIIEHQLGQPAILLIRPIFVKFENETGFLFEWLEAAHAFEVYSYVWKHHVAFPHDAADVLTGPAPERIDRGVR